MKPRHLVIVGERDGAKRAHVAIESSIAIYERQTGQDLRYSWLSTDSIMDGSGVELLSDATGIWCAPGSPYASTDGALQSIAHARELDIPFLGTCGGFQHALMEYVKNVMGGTAFHQELNPETADPLITKLSCSLVGAEAKVVIKPGSKYAKLVHDLEVFEEFNCNYGLAQDFEIAFDATELEFVAHDEAGQARVFWHRSHPFFVGSLFQPERRALKDRIHPLVYDFLHRT